MVTVERACTGDAVHFFEMEQAADTHEYILSYSVSEHGRKIADPRFVYLRILEGGKIAGFLILVPGPDPDSVEFRRVVVSAKGRGTGQLAITAMEQFCRRELQRARVWLDVFEHNERGRHVYEKLGYEQYGESRLDGKRLLLYQKWL